MNPPKKLRRVILPAVTLILASALASYAQNFKTLVNFNETDGDYSSASVVQGFDGNLYGTTVYGGAYGHGNVFKITPRGQLTSIYSFCAQTNCPDGYYPEAPLVQATDGNLYGTTSGSAGVVGSGGTVFKITPDGVLTTVYIFCSQTNCSDGFAPGSNVIQGRDGNFYGTTSSGGTHSSGTVFKVSSAGALTTLYSFCSVTNCADGNYPTGTLVQGSDQNFYGTTVKGGLYDMGSVFKITSGGRLKTLYNFCPKLPCTDGATPYAGLIQATDESFYGTTFSGGNATVCTGAGCGSIFKITSTGVLTTLYRFCSQTNCTDGSGPLTSLIQGSDGNFYGTTYNGGTSSNNNLCVGLNAGCGTVFEVTAAGELTTLYSLCSQANCTDGANPSASLFQGTNGKFYGTTPVAGNTSGLCSTGGGCGTVFAEDVGLGPFIETVPTSGKVGGLVKILGSNLASVSAVTFNGTAATFRMISPTEIGAVVPSGASTGIVQVTLTGGALSSNVPFQVLP